jgi:RNA polymerase sigma-70 factor (ECF subfamily)
VEFVALYERFYDEVLRYARRRVAEDAARDIVADTFLVAWRRPDAVPENALPWLLGVARNLVANESRRRMRAERLTRRIVAEPRVAQVDLTGQPGESPVTRALASLPAGDREVIALVAWEELGVAAAATVVGCTPGAFAVRLHRARRRLVRAVEQQSGGGGSGPERMPSPRVASSAGGEADR